MSYPFSDSESSDSDNGIRFKTQNTRKTVEQYTERHKPSNFKKDYSGRHPGSHRRHDRSRDRSRSKERSRRKYEETNTYRRRSSSSSRSNSSNDKRGKHKRCHENLHKSQNAKHSHEHSSSKTYSLSPITKHREIYDEDSSSSNKLLKFGPSLSSKSSQPEPKEESKKSTNTYGPSLPPNFVNKTETTYESKVRDKPKKKSDVPRKTIENSESSTFGPALPLQQENVEETNDDLKISSVPNLLKSENLQANPSQKCNLVIGPILPPHLREKLLQDAENHENTIKSDSEEEEEDVYGPVPPGHSKKTLNQLQLEERALQLKIQSLNPSDSNATVREEWMLELPEVHVPNLGLGPRQFRAKEGPDMSDRSSWTDTPKGKQKKSTEPTKVDLKKEAELKHIKERDKEQDKIVKELKKKKKRDKSLLEMHQEEINKKKKEKIAEKPERRPFDRDIDLKINRFDEAQKKAIFKKAQMLDDRFSRGESKFL